MQPSACVADSAPGGHVPVASGGVAIGRAVIMFRPEALRLRPGRRRAARAGMVALLLFAGALVALLAGRPGGSASLSSALAAGSGHQAAGCARATPRPQPTPRPDDKATSGTVTDQDADEDTDTDEAAHGDDDGDG